MLKNPSKIYIRIRTHRTTSKI